MVDELGEIVAWEYENYIIRRSYLGLWSEEYDFIGVNYILDAERMGFPWTARSTKAVGYVSSHSGGMLWPQSGSAFELGAYHPAVTYHPLGLILNPMIYALPVWLVLMGGRWGYLVRRGRRRAGLGRCVGCGYELYGLGVCPECGREHP